MQQLKPITQDMTDVELRQAIQMNFALILDAYTKGLNSIVFKGGTGATGSAGSRGASILATTRDNLLAAETASKASDIDMINVYSSVSTDAMANAVTKMLQQGDADATVNAMFKDLSFVSKTSDLVEYDIVIVESGVVFQLQYANSKWFAVPLNINLVTTYSITDDIASIVSDLVSAQIDGMKQLPYYTRKLTAGDATAYLIPGDLADNPTGLGGTVQSTVNLGPFIFAASEVQSGINGEGSTIFVGTPSECSKVFGQFIGRNVNELKGMPYYETGHVGGMPRIIVPSVGQYEDEEKGIASQQPAYKYGILFLDEQVVDFTDSASIQSVWSKATANITFKNGSLHFEAQPNADNGTDKRGCFIMSRKVFELWSQNGLIIHGQNGGVEIKDGLVKAYNLQFTDNDLKGAGTLGTDGSGNVIVSSGATADPTPVGTIIMWPGANMPTGQETNWHLCDGALLKRASYPKLFSIIGTTYNVTGDPSDSFRLPNLQQRFPIGAKTGTLNNGKNASGTQQTVNTALGQAGGASEIALIMQQLATHNHAFANHVHSMAHTHPITNHKHAISTDGQTDYKIIVNGEASHTHALNGANAEAVQGSTASTGGAHVHQFSTYTGTKRYANKTYSNESTDKIADGTHNHGGSVTDGKHYHGIRIGWGDTDNGKYNSWKGTGTPPLLAGGGWNRGNSLKLYTDVTDSTTLGKGGEHTHTISNATVGPLQVAGTTLNNSGYNGAHKHNLSGLTAAGSAHTHTISGYTGKAVTNSGTVTVSTDAASTANTGDSTTTPNSGDTGNGYAHANMPPYLAINFIIKVLG